MAKKSQHGANQAPLSLVAGAWSLIKRHPGKAITTIVVVLGGIPTAAAGYGMVMAFVDSAIPALHYWVDKRLAPVLLAQNTQAVAIDRFILYQQTEALAKAEADPGAAASPIVKERIKNLSEQIAETKARIRKATGK
ncbi:MAG: hypothetical protein KGL39_38335 [Patescibacteria group bacterium]|nr:hypothetical protein [Patescibacteria group bacterium]